MIKFQADSKDNILKMDKPFFPDYDQLDFSISEKEFTDTVCLLHRFSYQDNLF